MNTSVWFGSLDALLDAAMLFGGQLTTSDDGRVRRARYTVGRTRNGWRALYWLMALFHRHDVKLWLKSGLNTLSRAGNYGKIVFQTDLTCLLIAARRRWYAGGKPAVPADLVIDDSTLIVWLVDALIRPGRDVRLTAPGMDAATAERLLAQVARVVPEWPLDIRRHASGASIVGRAAGRDMIEAWAAERAPAVVWQPA